MTTRELMVFYNDAMRGYAMLVYCLWRRTRLRIGSAIIGGDYLGMTMRLWLIRERALDCITPEGSVILANCQPLSEALYEPIPGRWSLTVALSDAEPRSAVERSSETQPPSSDLPQ